MICYQLTLLALRLVLKNISLVTPCYNMVNTIDRTILSVVTQSGDFSVKYHIQDGGSTDGTLEALDKWKQRFDSGSWPLQCSSLEFSFNSSADVGMYDAIVKGISSLDLADSSWLSWINADDIIMPGAFALLAKIDDQIGEGVSWVGGSTAIFKDDVRIAWGDRPVSNSIVKSGLCDGMHWSFIQQEGTFFRKKNWDMIINTETFSSIKLVGDWYLWKELAARTEFFQVNFPLGGFFKRGYQLSSDMNSYYQEMDSMLSQEKRHNLMLALENQDIIRSCIVVDYATGDLSIEHRSISPLWNFWIANSLVAK